MCSAFLNSACNELRPHYTIASTSLIPLTAAGNIGSVHDRFNTYALALVQPSNPDSIVDGPLQTPFPLGHLHTYISKSSCTHYHVRLCDLKQPLYDSLAPCQYQRPRHVYRHMQAPRIRARDKRLYGALSRITRASIRTNHLFARHGYPACSHTHSYPEFLGPA